MVYLDISLEIKTAALAKVEDPAIAGNSKKWKNKEGLAEACGLISIKSYG